MKLDMKRGMLSKDLEKTLEFIVESKVSTFEYFHSYDFVF